MNSKKEKKIRYNKYNIETDIIFVVYSDGLGGGYKHTSGLFY